jgi:hypothetical protein
MLIDKFHIFAGVVTVSVSSCRISGSFCVVNVENNTNALQYLY